MSHQARHVAGHTASTALIAQAWPSPGCSTASCNRHPCGVDISGSHHDQRNVRRLGGRGRRAAPATRRRGRRSAASTHRAPKRPRAAPRRRPWAPPLAPAQASTASASASVSCWLIHSPNPIAATASSAVPSTHATSARPLDDDVHVSTSWRTASSTVSSSRRSTGRALLDLESNDVRPPGEGRRRRRRCTRRAGTPAPTAPVRRPGRTRSAVRRPMTLRGLAAQASARERRPPRRESPAAAAATRPTCGAGR